MPTCLFMEEFCKPKTICQNRGVLAASDICFSIDRLKFVFGFLTKNEKMHVRRDVSFSLIPSQNISPPTGPREVVLDYDNVFPWK